MLLPGFGIRSSVGPIESCAPQMLRARLVARLAVDELVVHDTETVAREHGQDLTERSLFVSFAVATSFQ